MAGMVEKKLAALGITLPTPAAPIANYVPFVRSGNMLIVSGQLCFGADGKLAAKGRLGDTVSIEDGKKPRAPAPSICWRRSRQRSAISTRSCASSASAASSIRRPALPMARKVMNGASDLMVEVFGDNGRHARSTVGVAALPADAAVEVEGQFEVNRENQCRASLAHRATDRPSRAA